MAIVERRFSTSGMHCPSCSMLIEMEVSDLAGVESVSSDHREGVTRVRYDDSVCSPTDIVDAITKAGYGATLLDA